MKKFNTLFLIYSKNSHLIELGVFILMSILITSMADSYLFNPFLLVIIYLSYLRGINNYLFTVIATTLTGLIINISYGIEIGILNIFFFIFCLFLCLLKKDSFFKRYGPFILTHALFIILYLIKFFTFDNVINLLVSFISSSIILYGYLNLEKCLIEPSREFEGKAKVIVLSTFSLIFFGVQTVYLVITRLIHIMICKTSSSVEGCLAIILNCAFIYFLQNGSNVFLISLLVPSCISIFLNKRMVIPAYMFSYIFIFLYLSDKFYLDPGFYQGLVAILISLVIPDNFYKKINDLFSREESILIKDNNERLEELSGNITDIVNYLDFVLSSSIDTNFSPVEKTIDYIEGKVCSNCEKRNRCSLREIMLDSLENEFTKENKTTLFEHCLYPYKIIRNLRIGKNTLNNERKYLEEIKNKNDMYIQELENIYKPLRNVFSQSDIVNKKKTQVVEELEAYHYKVSELSIGHNLISFQIALSNKEEISKVLTIISNCMNKTYYLEEMFFILSLGMYQISLSSRPLFSVDQSIISYGANLEYNGDSYLAFNENNHFYLMLSDGVGHNKNSQNVSYFMTNALNSYRKIEPQINRQIDNINTLLKTKINEEMYATLDYLDIDLIKGEMEIFKCGSFNSYLFRNNTLIKFKSNTPPLGIIYNIKTTSLTKELLDGDILIFMTDGYRQEPEEILEQTLRNNYKLKSESLCALLDKELNKYREIEDDKTLIVVKFQTIKEFKKVEEKQKVLQNS